MLTDASAFRNARTVNSLVLEDVALADLDDFANVDGETKALSLSRMPKLTSTAGLSGLDSVESQCAVSELADMPLLQIAACAPQR